MGNKKYPLVGGDTIISQADSDIQIGARFNLNPLALFLVNDSLTVRINPFQGSFLNSQNGLDDEVCVMLSLQSDESAHGLRQTVYQPLQEYGLYSYQYQNAFLRLSLHEPLRLKAHHALPHLSPHPLQNQLAKPRKRLQ